MRNFKLTTKLAAASLLAASAAFATPAAFADDHYRDPQHGQSSQHHSGHDDHHDRGHDNRHDDHRNDHHDNRHYAPPPRVVHENHYSSRVVYRTRQPVFYRGRSVPTSYRHAFQPVPAAYRYRVAPPPRGYQVGYYQGYSVVYDPATFLVLSVVDLLVNN